MLKLFSLLSKNNIGKPTSSTKPVESVPIYTAPTSDTKNTLSQRQATQQIIEMTPLSHNHNVNELTRIAQERSDRLYNERQQRIAKFNPFDLDKNHADNSPLTSTQKYFLKQMHGQSIENPTVYAYWIYEYSLDFEKVMAKFLSNGYLQVSNSFFEVELLKVDELKNILRKHSLSTSGKKAELIQRIKNNISSEQLTAELGSHNKKYALTEKGKEALTGLPNSMTKNLELEDLCLKYIFNKQLNEAYKLVCENELNKIIPRGIGMDWKHELTNGLSDFKLKLYTDFLENNTNSIPKPLKPYEIQMKACVILGDFWGVAISKSADLFMRIIESGNVSKSEVVSALQEMHFKLSTAIQKHSLEILKS